MKKEYRTPFLVMESFQLDAAIAASCSSEEASDWGTPLGFNKGALGWAAETCLPESSDYPLFSYYFGERCEADIVPTQEEIDKGDTNCYHAPLWYLDVAIYS